MTIDPPQDRSSRDGLPVGSVVPGADIWDDDGDDNNNIWSLDSGEMIDLDEHRPGTATDVAGDAESDGVWLHDAQVVARTDDEGPHDGSRGIEADESPSEAFGTKVHRWAGTSVLGASLAGMGIAIDKVLFDRDPTQIEIQAEDDADDHHDPIEVKLDTDHPDQSVAVLRPWLADGRQQPGADPHNS